MELEFPVLQPKRIVYSKNDFYLGATGDLSLVFDTLIYSSAAKPVFREISLMLRMVDEIVTYREVLKALGVSVPV